MIFGINNLTMGHKHDFRNKIFIEKDGIFQYFRQVISVEEEIL